MDCSGANREATALACRVPVSRCIDLLGNAVARLHVAKASQRRRIWIEKIPIIEISYDTARHKKCHSVTVSRAQSRLDRNGNGLILARGDQYVRGGDRGTGTTVVDSCSYRCIGITNTNTGNCHRKYELVNGSQQRYVCRPRFSVERLVRH